MFKETKEAKILTNPQSQKSNERGQETSKRNDFRFPYTKTGFVKKKKLKFETFSRGYKRF